MKCLRCQMETYLPFRCPYCNQNFCVEHRLPENHGCPEIWRARAPRGQLPETPSSSDKPLYQHIVSLTPPQKHMRRILRFSKTELKHLLFGTLLTLAIGFSMPLYGMPGFYSYPITLVVLAVIFTFSFITHELAHKITAQHFGLWAEFRITTYGTLITLLSIVSPFKIISPGAVMIEGMGDISKIGKTSIAGPLTNLTLAVFFLASRSVFSGSYGVAFEFGAIINSVIATFNLIPFGILDGFKTFLWNKMIWATVFSASLAFTIYSYLGFPFL